MLIGNSLNETKLVNVPSCSFSIRCLSEWRNTNITEWAKLHTFWLCDGYRQEAQHSLRQGETLLEQINWWWAVIMAKGIECPRLGTPLHEGRWVWVDGARKVFWSRAIKRPRNGFFATTVPSPSSVLPSCVSQYFRQYKAFKVADDTSRLLAES